MADLNQIELPNGSTYSFKDDSAVANITRSGTTFTATKRDGTTFTFTQQDNNTTYTVATGDSNGQIKVTPSGGTAYNVSIKGLGTAAYKGDTDFVINYKGASRSTATTGTWVSMVNSSQTGSPVLPTSGKWWHLMSFDCWGSAPNNWTSQLAVATQDGGGVWWRRNDASGTSIDSSTWHRLAEGDSDGNAVNANKVNNLTVQTAVPANAVFTDTKNTAGSTDTSSKIFLIGATSQAANPQTYSQDTAYVGTDGCLYSGGSKVLTSHQDISGKVNRSGDTMTGALNFANATANKMGDDAQVGDHNKGGSFGVQGLNGPTTITLLKQGGTWGNTEGGSIQYNATTKSLDFIFT